MILDATKLLIILSKPTFLVDSVSMESSSFIEYGSEKKVILQYFYNTVKLRESRK